MHKDDFTIRLTRAVKRLRSQQRLVILDVEDIWPVMLYLIIGLNQRDDRKPVARAVERVIKDLMAQFDDVDPTLVEDGFRLCRGHKELPPHD